jgi:hypothetical protein
MQADQGQHAQSRDHAVSRAALIGLLDAGLELSDRIVPLAGDEAFRPGRRLLVGQVPAHAELLADSLSGLKCRPGLREPVKLGQQMDAGQVQREAVPLPAGTLVRQPHRLVDDGQRVLRVTAEVADQGGQVHGDAGGQVIPGRGRRGPGLLGSGGGAVRRKIFSRSVGGNTGWATSARPPLISMACSWASAPSNSVTNSGFPPAPAISVRSLGPGSGGDGVGHQPGHRIAAQRAHGHSPGSNRLQRATEPDEILAPWPRPQAQDHGYRQIFQPAAQRCQRHQAGRIGPLQVV